MSDKWENVLIHGDCIEGLRHSVLPTPCVDLTFTSPPYYNARDYGYPPHESYYEYLDFLCDVFDAVHRITKPGGFLVVNTSPVLTPRGKRSEQSIRHPIPFDLHYALTAEEKWDFLDDIIWLKPDGAAIPRVNGFAQHRRPLAYKPNPVTEYLMVYRRHTTRLIDWNIRQHDEDTIQASLVDDYEPTNVWRITPAHDDVHPAVFPIELAQRVIKLYSFVGDVVLDPFAGVGTVGIAARGLSRRYVMIEQNEQYCQRMLGSLGQMHFDGTPFRYIEQNTSRKA